MRVQLAYRFGRPSRWQRAHGVIGLHVRPFPAQNTVLALTQARQPAVYAGFVYTYATVRFSTPSPVLSAARWCVYTFVARWDRPTTSQPLPPRPRSPQLRTWQG